MQLSQTILGIRFQNPTVLASGIMGIMASGWKFVARSGAGAVTTKSMWATAHAGNPTPVVVSTPQWTLNAVGVPYAGVEVALQEVGAYVEERPVPIIASVIGMNPEEIRAIVEPLAAIKPDAFEINLSTPTFLKLRGRFLAEDLPETAAIIASAKRAANGIPIFVKLTPNVSNIGEIAKACVDAGADGITAINTVGPAMAIDLRSRVPVLSAQKGGLSGRAIKPIAVRCIADIFAATGGTVPIIGVGGVATGEDALELMLAGASLVGIGTAVAERGMDVFSKVTAEMEAWCDAEGVKDVSDVIGGMHRALQAMDTPYH